MRREGKGATVEQPDRRGPERQARRGVGDKPWGEPEGDDQVAFNGWSEAETSIGGEGGNLLFRSY